MATPYLAITDGTTTCTIITSGAAIGDYALRSWVPSVAGWRRGSTMGGREYEDVIEKIDLTIIDTTAAACYTRLDTITRLLEQAERAYYGEKYTPVYLHYSPPGASVSSSSTPLKARIIGRAPGMTIGAVEIAEDPDSTQFTLRLDITIMFWRFGEWLVDTQSASSSATDNGTVATIAIGSSTNNLSPTEISLSKIVLQTSRAFVMLADDDNVIDVLNADTMTATGYTAVDESAKFAKNTNVLRYTPPDTVENASGNKTTTAVTGVQLTDGVFAVYANIRNNSSTTSYKMRVRLNGDGATTYTPYYYILPYSGSAYPEWAFIGMAYSWRLLTVAIYLQASAASGTLDIDSLCLVNLFGARVNVLGTSLLESGAATYVSGSGALGISHNLDAAFPFLYPRSQTIAGGSTVTVHTSQGNAIFYTSSSSIYGVLLATGTSSSLDAWRQADSGTVLNNVWTATRTVGYLTPR